MEHNDINRDDRLSSLPDSLLLDLLSRLKYKHIVQTSILSKRWRYLWTFSYCLDFDSIDTGDDDENIAIIDRCLSHHQKFKVHNLRIVIMYNDKHRLTVDSWIHFAIKTNVEDFMLDLIFEDTPEDYEDLFMYKLPDTLFKCGSSLTTLALCYCHLDLPTTINLWSLKVLSLYYIELPLDAIEHLTLGCPILENLKLEGCNRFDNLNITIKNKHFKILEIDDFLANEDYCGSITLDIPNVRLLIFSTVLPRNQYHLKNLQSVITADLSTIGELHIYDNNALAEVVHGLRHVKNLKLSSSCIQRLSLRKIQGLEPLFIQATNIKLSVGYTKWELPGIAYLLQSAYRLESFTISIDKCVDLEMQEGFMRMHDFDGKRYWKSQGPSFLTSVLQNIKTIEIEDFLGGRSVFEHPYHTNHHDLGMECFGNEMIFVELLLENAKALERMVIKTAKDPHDPTMGIEEVTLMLTGCTKASPNAELLVT